MFASVRLFRVSRLAACMAALALMVRALVPAGFMVAPVGQSTPGLPIVLCTGQGDVPALLRADGTVTVPGAAMGSGAPADPAPGGFDHSDCVFAHATASPAAPPAAGPSAPALLRDPARPVVASLDLVPGRGLAAPPPPSTAPPIPV